MFELLRLICEKICWRIGERIGGPIWWAYLVENLLENWRAYLVGLFGGELAGLFGG